MKRASYIGFFVLLALATLPFGGLAQVASTPGGAARSFFKALENAQLQAAIDLSVVIPDGGESAATRLREIIARVSAVKAVPEVIDTLKSDNLAVSITLDAVRRPNGGPDYDPCYLLRDGDTWKVILNATEIGHRRYFMSKAILAEYDQLEKWYYKRVREIESAPKGGKPLPAKPILSPPHKRDDFDARVKG